MQALTHNYCILFVNLLFLHSELANMMLDKNVYISIARFTYQIFTLPLV